MGFKRWLAKKLLGSEMVERTLAARKIAANWEPLTQAKCIAKYCNATVKPGSKFCPDCGIYQQDDNLPPVVQIVQTQPLPVQRQHTEPIRIQGYPALPVETSLLPLIPSTSKEYFPGVNLHRNKAIQQKAGKR